MGLLRWLFGPDIPPAASEWDEKEYNQHLSRTLSNQKVNLIKIADERSKQRYDEIDAHIEKLNRVKEKIRYLKRKKLAEADKIAQEQPESSPEIKPEPAT